MAVSKVILNGTTIMDTTQVTVTADNLVQPYTALGKNGATLTGTLGSGDDELYGTSTIAAASSKVGAGVIGQAITG